MVRAVTMTPSLDSATAAWLFTRYSLPASSFIRLGNRLQETFSDAVAKHLSGYIIRGSNAKGDGMADGRDAAMIAAVAADPRYRALVARRARLGWWLSALIFVIYTGYLLLIAFDKALLGAPIGDGVTSVGIPVGIGVILIGILLTGLYVAHANRHYDKAMADILADHRA